MDFGDVTLRRLTLKTIFEFSKKKINVKTTGYILVQFHTVMYLSSFCQ